MTQEQISRWMEYYLCEFGKAVRTHNDEYGEICWKRLFVLRDLAKAMRAGESEELPQTLEGP